MLRWPVSEGFDSGSSWTPSSLEQRFAERRGRDVIEENMGLHENAHVRAARAVHRDLRFDAELPVSVDPDEAWIDSTRCLSLTSRQRNLHYGNDVREWLR